MKILVDQNISFRLVQRIQSSFSEIEHVKSLGLINADDFDIFMSARNLGFAAILTQDQDFQNLILEHNSPPKVIWLRIGNCSTPLIAEVILRNSALIKEFIDAGDQDCLEIYL